MTTSRKLNKEFFTLPNELRYSALFISSPLEWTLVNVNSSAKISFSAAASCAITAFIQACCNAMISRSSGPNGRRSGFWSLRFGVKICSTMVLMTRRPLRFLLSRDDLAIAHVDDAIAELGRLGIVSDHQNRLAQFFVRLPQHLQNSVGVFGVEVPRGLVCQDKGGLVHQRASQRHA